MVAGQGPLSVEWELYVSIRTENLLFHLNGCHHAENILQFYPRFLLENSDSRSQLIEALLPS